MTIKYKPAYALIGFAAYALTSVASAKEEARNAAPSASRHALQTHEDVECTIDDQGNKVVTAEVLAKQNAFSIGWRAQLTITSNFSKTSTQFEVSQEFFTENPKTLIQPPPPLLSQQIGPEQSMATTALGRTVDTWTKTDIFMRPEDYVVGEAVRAAENFKGACAPAKSANQLMM